MRWGVDDVPDRALWHAYTGGAGPGVDPDRRPRWALPQPSERRMISSTVSSSTAPSVYRSGE